MEISRDALRVHQLNGSTESRVTIKSLGNGHTTTNGRFYRFFPLFCCSHAFMWSNLKLVWTFGHQIYVPKCQRIAKKRKKNVDGSFIAKSWCMVVSTWSNLFTAKRTDIWLKQQQRIFFIVLWQVPDPHMQVDGSRKLFFVVFSSHSIRKRNGKNVLCASISMTQCVSAYGYFCSSDTNHVTVENFCNCTENEQVENDLGDRCWWWRAVVTLNESERERGRESESERERGRERGGGDGSRGGAFQLKY